MPTLLAARRHDLDNDEWSVLEHLLPRGKKAGRPPKWAKRQLIDGIPLADPNWRAMAGRPAGVRPVAVGVRAVPPLAAGRHLEAAAHSAAGPGRRGRARDLGRLRRLGHRAGAPARGRGQEERRRAEGAARRGRRPRAGRSRPGPVPRRPDQQVPPGLRAGPEAPGGHRDRRAPPRQPPVHRRAGRHQRPRPGGGGPAPGPDRVLADKAYGSRANRAYLRRRGIRCTIPEEEATRSPTGRRRAAQEARRPPSTRRNTSSATPSNAASTGSSATAPSRPATTSSPSATRRHSTSPPSANGSAPSLLKHALDDPARRQRVCPPTAAVRRRFWLRP